MKKLVMLAALGVAVVAHASDWQLVGSNNASRLTIDRASIKTQGKHVLLWSKQVFSQPQTNMGIKFDTVMTRMDMDCANEVVGVRVMTFSLEGKIVTSIDNVDPAPIAPDSVANDIENAVCHNAAK